MVYDGINVNDIDRFTDEFSDDIQEQLVCHYPILNYLLEHVDELNSSDKTESTKSDLAALILIIDPVHELALSIRSDACDLAIFEDV